jgi:PAS domain-containing protein
MGVLARVATRPSPKIQLGPVDMTCAFVVSDTRRYDSPIVYASPSFFQLTGYSEHEVMGRNCRFLQAPDGRVTKGEERRYTSPEAVSLLRKCLSADKECQTSLVNYKKGGQAFINLVTVIPVVGGVNDSPEERDRIVYHVGFQVDLTQQPNAILQRLKDGSYIVNYSSSAALAAPGGAGARRPQPSAPLVPMSAELRRLLADEAFVRSIPLTTSANALASAERADAYDDHQLLHMLMLEALPDFVHVLSLKGVFLYAAPSVRRVLGYEPGELVGRSVADLCHPADLVPLMRELKESSTAASQTPGEVNGTVGVATGMQSVQAALAGGSGPMKTVDLLFRCRAKAGGYVWLDCRGRLHVEAGKGRKAIIMSGRQRGLPALAWGQVERAGGLAAPAPGSVARPPTPPSATAAPDTPEDDAERPRAPEREFWAELSASGAVLFVGTGARDVLGWGAGELIGRAAAELIDGADARAALAGALAHAAAGAPDARTQTVRAHLVRRDGARADAEVVVYPGAGGGGARSSLARGAPAPAPLVVQVRLVRAGSGALPLAHAPGDALFAELDVGRETSWQYELQQLKYANRRLADAVEALEADADPAGGEWRAAKRARSGGSEDE